MDMDQIIFEKMVGVIIIIFTLTLVYLKWILTDEEATEEERARMGKVFKQCKCGNYCESGYCPHCREKDANERYIKAHERKAQNRKSEVLKHDSGRSIM